MRELVAQKQIKSYAIGPAKERRYIAVWIGCITPRARQTEAREVTHMHSNE